MLYALLLAHLLGDYVFQSSAIARWKSRSILGVLVHGGIVTTCTLICTIWFDPGWWPYALIIGGSHTVIDIARARLLPRNLTTGWELTLYLLDQMLHLAIIGGALWWTGEASLRVLVESIHPQDPRWLAVLTGFCVLTWPSWILARFMVRGLWGPNAAPPLPQGGEKYGPMLERILIATCVLFGQPMLAPLVLVPRPLMTHWAHAQGVASKASQEHWAEMLLSVLLAVYVGVMLRTVL